MNFVTSYTESRLGSGGTALTAMLAAMDSLLLDQLDLAEQSRYWGR